MELKDQICSLELAKELKKLGTKQKSLWCWFEYKDKQGSVYNICDKNRTYQYQDGTKLTSDNKFIASAYTVAELGNILSKYGNYITWMTNKNKWAITRMNYMEFPELDSDTEANARAKCLIYLLKMG